jgi:hypothetical protein
VLLCVFVCVCVCSCACGTRYSSHKAAVSKAGTSVHWGVMQLAALARMYLRWFREVGVNVLAVARKAAVSKGWRHCALAGLKCSLHRWRGGSLRWFRACACGCAPVTGARSRQVVVSQSDRKVPSLFAGV